MTSAGDIDPILEVADNPVGKIVGFDVIVISLIEEVAETPVSPITSAGDIDPTEEVAACPVTPITSAGDNEPTDEVAEGPVGVSETLPIIVGAPILDVAETPVTPITSAGEIEPTLVVAD
jgi:hypothetical protein